jgi:F0F1-type ATP synthase membrane subunit b/b'
LARADVARKDAQSLRAKHDAHKVQVKQQAVLVLEQGKKDVEYLRKHLVENAAQEIERIKTRTTREIAYSRQTAMTALFTEASSLAVGVARRALKDMVQADDHRRFFERTVAGIERRFQEVA